MRVPHFVTLLVVIFVAWGSLFLTVLHQSHQTNQVLRGQSKQLSQEAVIIQRQKDTIDILSSKVDSLQSHVDCLFNLATHQPGSRIANADTCLITGSSNFTTLESKATSESKAPQDNSSNSNQPSQSPSPQPKPTPKGLLDKLTGGLL